MFTNNKKQRRKTTQRNLNKSSGEKKSYRSNNYRSEYFKHNKGLFGKIHFCHYCGKPLTKKYVEVDHIIPVSKSRMNTTWNLVSACRKCNRSKSDKVNGLVIVGFGTKIVGNIIGLPIKVAGYSLTGFFKLGGKGKIGVIILLAMIYFYFSNKGLTTLGLPWN